MYIRRALAAALVAIILSGIPLAADESDAEYAGIIHIANAGAAVSGVTVRLDLNTQAFIDGGMLDATFNNIWYDTAAGNAMAFMPKPGATGQWYFYHSGSLAATATTLAHLYMGGPDMSAPIRYLPGATGMTAVDAATLEPGNDWTVELKGYVSLPADNSGTPRNLLYKQDAVWLAGMQDGIMAMLCIDGDAFSDFYPGTTSIEDPGSVWANETNIDDSNTATGADVGSTPATSWTDYIICRMDAWNLTIPAIRFYAEYDAASWTQIDVDAYYSGAWHDVYMGTYPNSSWTTVWLPGAYTVTQVRTRFYNSAGTAQTEAALLRDIEWCNHVADRAILFAPTASGEHTVNLDFANPNVTLTLDGAVAATGTVTGGGVNDNAVAWVSADDASFAYLEYLKQWQGATLRQHIEWENAATFTDLSGNGNDATPSFPAASSDPDVTATLAAMVPLAPAEAPGTSTDSGSSMSGTLPTVPDNLFGELDADMEDIPGVAVVNSILDAGDIPRALFWFLFVFAAIVGLCLLTYHLSKSLMAMSLVAGAGMLFASRIGIIPYWVTVPLVLIALAVLVKEKMSPL